ncbi:lipopolysaccharide assembly protein LapB [Streptomyces sp. NK15101]|uniref:tetratricopeptide repeat protein n=1 Tax=Streptomyces sp. NK15101 TaxID=2873261 RepID=UPI001CEDFB00|nr:hypothetical protein [Streptomyces sp. NK15101]
MTIVGERARHERLWRVTGSDLEALNEISAAFEKVIGDSSGFSHTDINDVVRLAQGRDAIHDQTGNLPPKLLSLWAHFGDFDRAVNLAYAQEAGHKRQLALTEVAKALASLGKPDLALEIGTSIAHAGDNSFEISEIARTLIAEGHLEHAVELAGLVAKPEKLLTVKLALMRSQGLPGGNKTAENFLTEFMAVAMSAPDSHERGTLLALIAGTLAAIGFPEEGVAVTEQATSLAESTVPKYRAAQSLAGIARTLSKLNELTKEAEEIARKAGQTAASIEDPQERAWSLSLVNSALVKTGQYHLAVQLCNTLKDSGSLGESIAKVITELSDSGQHDLALQLLNEASPLLDRTERAIALADLANALAKTGEPARSADCAHQALQATEDLPEEWGIIVSVSVAWALYRAGFVDQSRDLAHEITEMARTRIDAHAQVGALCAAAKSLNGTCHEKSYSALLRRVKKLVSAELSGYRKILHLCTVADASPPAEARKLLEHAITITEERLHFTERSEALAKIATTLADIGSISRAIEVADKVVESLQLSGSPYEKAWDTASAIRALCAVNDFDKAEELTGTLVESDMVSEALAEIASGLAYSGRIDQATSVAEEIQDGRERDHALRAIACALASHGDRVHALEIAHQIDTKTVAERALSVLAGAFAADGEYDEALLILEEIDTASTRGEALGAVAMELGPTEQGRRYLSEALSLTRWDSLLEAMAAVSPGSLKVVAEHVIAPVTRL